MTSSSIKNELTQAGFKTTSLSANEASFEHYGYYLGDNVKDMITDSFDCDADYELQARVASLFGNKRNVMQNGTFVSSLKSMGLSVSTQWVQTQYMVDEKSAGHGSRKVRNGGINVYTISDGKGGEIVIADANGNAAIEVEEVFMNQILSDIAVDVDLIKQFENEGINISVGGDSSAEGNEDEEISQTEFNLNVEKYINRGLSVEDAELKAQLENNAFSLHYTGTKKDNEDKENYKNALNYSISEVSKTEEQNKTEKEKLNKIPKSKEDEYKFKDKNIFTK